MVVLLVILRYIKLFRKGFLSIDDPSASVPGNAGLKDQTLALKWIRENVHHFGGQQNNITVFGESAGGASVHWHMLSNFSNGLFDKAIVQSGSALIPWANGSGKDKAERLARKLGWDGVGGNIRLLEFLRGVAVVDLIRAQEISSEDGKQEWSSQQWIPSIEPYTAEQSFFTCNALKTYKSAWGNRIPLIIGGTTEEGLLFYHQIVANSGLFTDENAFKNLIPRMWNLSSDRVNEFAQQLKSFYIGEDKFNEDNLGKFFDILADTNFWHGMHLAIGGRLQDEQAAPTYVYRFAFSGDPRINVVRQILVPNHVKGMDILTS